MKFQMSAPVKGHSPQEIIRVFDFDLLRALSPPMMKPDLVSYGGYAPGTTIHFRLNTPFGIKDWKGMITEYRENEAEIYFIDQGVELPFGIKSWKHKHRLIRTTYGTEIRDEVEFSFYGVLSRLVLTPGIWLQFLYRKPLYSKIISRRLKKQM
jgi:ligand-binding SRPBCC domain-containing protein